jgi:hypothetical protein
MRPMSSPVAAYLVALLVNIAIVCASAQVHLPMTHTAVDRTSFIVKFDEALIAPVSIAAIDCLDEADPEAVRAAAQELSGAAAAAAARLADLARQAGINMQVVDTYGKRSFPAGITTVLGIVKA